jgi:hypothetical protein
VIKYNEIIIYPDHVILDNNYKDSILGKHCIWIPSIEAKIILSFQGCIESTAWPRGKNADKIRMSCLNESPDFLFNSLISIVNEVEIIRKLSYCNMSPPVIGYFHIKNVISKIFTRNWYSDDKGMYGYFVKNANKLPPGQYNFEKFKSLFLDTGIIKANPGAIGDLERKEGNLVNGYLVDVRRTREYCMQLNGDIDLTELEKI